jgi:hypothetical protein
MEALGESAKTIFIPLVKKTSRQTNLRTIGDLCMAAPFDREVLTSIW